MPYTGHGRLCQGLVGCRSRTYGCAWGVMKCVDLVWAILAAAGSGSIGICDRRGLKRLKGTTLLVDTELTSATIKNTAGVI